MNNRFITFLRSNAVQLRNFFLVIATIIFEVFLPCSLLERDASGDIVGLTVYHYYDIFMIKQGITFPFITFIATLLAAVFVILFIATKKIIFLIMEDVIILAAIIIMVTQIPGGTFGYENIIELILLAVIFINQILDYFLIIRRLKNRH